MLRPKPALRGGSETSGVTSLLADEIEQLYYTPSLDLLSGARVKIGVRCCLDLAAVRGLREVRGKGAALCGCQGKEGRQRIPGEDDVPSIGEGDDLLTWKEAHEILKAYCYCDSSLLSYESLRSAAHVPPDDYVYTHPWCCPHCEQDMFFSRDEYEAAVAALQGLKEKVDAGDEAAEKQYAKVMSAHAQGHLDQMLFVTPVLQTGTDIFI
eukprot:2216197-Pleurochrysis_carterae.AAC.1